MQNKKFFNRLPRYRIRVTFVTPELKKLFKIMGVVFVIFASIITVSKSYDYYIDHRPSVELSSVVYPMIRDLAASRWNNAMLVKYAAPEFQQWLSDNTLTDGLPEYNYLGGVTQFISFEKLDMNDDHDDVTVVAAIQFQRGATDVTVHLSKHDEKWLISSFKIDPDFFHRIAKNILNPVVDPMIRDIAASRWDSPILIKYATPEFQKWLWDNKLVRGLPGFGSLGDVIRFLGFKDLDMNNAFNFATVVASFQFQAGPGDVTLQLSKRDGKWLIYRCSVDSPVFHRNSIAK